MFDSDDPFEVHDVPVRFEITGPLDLDLAHDLSWYERVDVFHNDSPLGTPFNGDDPIDPIWRSHLRRRKEAG